MFFQYKRKKVPLQDTFVQVWIKEEMFSSLIPKNQSEKYAQ